MSFFVGLDLGQKKDYTALSVLQQADNELHCRHLLRYKLGTTYPDIVDDVTRVIEKLRQNQPRATRMSGDFMGLKGRTVAFASGGITLCLDATGVGAPVVDMFRKSEVEAKIIAITITGGLSVTKSSSVEFGVPKRDLASNMAVLMETGRFKVANKLPDAAVLREELQNFQVKINASGNEQYAADWRHGTNDDLCLSVMMAAWYAEKVGKKTSNSQKPASGGPASGGRASSSQTTWHNKQRSKPRGFRDSF